MPSGDLRPPSSEWQQGYDAGYREAQQDAALTDAPSPTEPPCGDDSWDTRYECVKPSGHPVEGPGLTSHEYRFKRATPSPDAPGLTANSKSLRVAAERVLDDWNRIGAQADGYRALRAALNAPSPETPGLREAAERAASYLDTYRGRAHAVQAARGALRAALAATPKEPKP